MHFLIGTAPNDLMIHSGSEVISRREPHDAGRLVPHDDVIRLRRAGQSRRAEHHSHRAPPPTAQCTPAASTEERSEYGIGINAKATVMYQAFGRTIATRTGTKATYLLADHLGSTVGSVSADGSEVHQVRYWPYGKVRSGGVGTDKMYTGQQMESGSLLGSHTLGGLARPKVRRSRAVLRRKAMGRRACVGSRLVNGSGGG